MKTNRCNLRSGRVPAENSHSSSPNTKTTGYLLTNLAEGARLAPSRARIAALVLFLAVTGLSVLPAAAAASDPQQAVVFNTSTELGAVSLVAFTGNGFLRHIGELRTCQEPELPDR